MTSAGRATYRGEDVSLEDLQATEQYLEYVMGLLQQAADSISTALAYAAQHAGQSQGGAGIHQALGEVESSIHHLQDMHTEVHGQVQAEIATEQQNQESGSDESESELPDNPYN
jgi:hypothetical protein